MSGTAAEDAAAVGVGVHPKSDEPIAGAAADVAKEKDAASDCCGAASSGAGVDAANENDAAGVVRYDDETAFGDG